MIDDTWTDEDRRRAHLAHCSKGPRHCLECAAALAPRGAQPLPSVTFDGVPAKSVVRMEDGSILAEAPSDPQAASYRVIDSFVMVLPDDAQRGAQPAEQASGETPPTRGWLPIASHQIKRGERVLVYASIMRVATHDGYGWELDEGGYCDPTLWMPVELPRA